LSKTLKCSRPRSGTSRPVALVTVAHTATVRLPALNVGCCGVWPARAAAAPTQARVTRNGRGIAGSIGTTPPAGAGSSIGSKGSKGSKGSRGSETRSIEDSFIACNRFGNEEFWPAPCSARCVVARFEDFEAWKLAEELKEKVFEF